MRKLLSIYAAVLVVSLILINTQGASAQVELTCVEANGLTWCYNPNQCGQACNEVCASGGMRPIESNTIWFEAQNTEEKCTVLSEALGLGDDTNLGSYTYGCLEDQSVAFHGPGLNGPLFCSTFEFCPESHRTFMDQSGTDCDSQQSSRRSICPCESIPPRSIPAMTEWGLIAMAGVLGIIGFMVIRRRRAQA